MAPPIIRTLQSLTLRSKPAMAKSLIVPVLPLAVLQRVAKHVYCLLPQQLHHARLMGRAISPAQPAPTRQRAAAIRHHLNKLHKFPQALLFPVPSRQPKV
jgi:hypothetical protein